MEQSELLFNPKILTPEALLFSAALILTAVAILRPKINPTIVGYIGMFVFATASALVAFVPFGSAYSDLFINEPSAQFFKLIFLAMGFFSVAIYMNENRHNSSPNPFQLPLLILSVLAMMLLSMSGNLISLFSTLELCAIPLIMIVAFQNSASSGKHAQKFLLVMLLSSLLILFGLAFLFGLSGSANLLQMKLQIAIVHLTQREIGIIILLSVAAMLSGLMLKAALPPFNNWGKELHDNNPHSIISFIAVAFVIAVLVAFAKLFINGLFAFYGPEMTPNDWGRLVSFVAFVAIVFGTANIFRQRDIVPFMRYSNFVQIGFIITGMVSMNQYGLQSAAFYMVAFMLAAAGIYTIMSLLKSSGFAQIANLRGLYYSSKMLSVTLAIFLMSLAGLPLTIGFVAKFSVIEAALSMATVDKMYHWMFILAATATISAVVTFIKFTKITLSLFAKTENAPISVKTPFPVMIVLVITVLATILFGILPEPLLAYAAKISQAFGFMLE